MRNNKEMVERWKGLRVDRFRYFIQPIHLSTYQLSIRLKCLTIGFFLTFLLSGCYEDRKGCLDLRATNFDIDADRECDGCCVYPQLRLVFEHKLSPDSTANLTYNMYPMPDWCGKTARKFTQQTA